MGPLSGGTDTGDSALNAKLAMDRAVELARGTAWGVVALGNNNHWMRAAAPAGRQRTRDASVSAGPTSCPTCLPGAEGTEKSGNNPFIMSIPEATENTLSLTAAYPRFSYGKIEEAKLKGTAASGSWRLADTKGNLTTDPAEIEKTWRVLPMGYWKGSGISIALDLIATRF